MNDNGKRVVGYGAGLVISAGLIYGGFIHESDPDVGTLLSAVEIQLRLAGAMPATDADGATVQARVDLLATASTQLDHAERIDPSVLEVRDYRAYIAFLQGRYESAATEYRDLRAEQRCPSGLRERSVINEARMLRLAGRRDDARELLEAHRAAVSADFAKSVRAELAAMEASQTSGKFGADAESAAVPAK